ncbi:MAG: hypothetical protein ACRC0A_05125 [Chitinophagaceae bacterium]
MNIKYFLFFYFMVSVSFSQTISIDWKCINHVQYSICYPDSIELDMYPMMQSSFVLFFPVGNKDLFRTNINLLIQDLKGSSIENLEQFVKLSEKQIITLIKNSSILENKPIVINDIIFHKLIFTGIQNQYFLKWAQYYTIREKKAYIVTFSSTINQFAYYEKIQNEIIATFKIK